MPVPSSVDQIDNSQWTSYKKLWNRLKIIRGKWKETKDQKIKDELKSEEIEICKKIVAIAPHLTNGKGEKITVPAFPLILGRKK